MERLVLAATLVLLGVPLSIFGWAIARRKFDLVFGDYTTETTVGSAWNRAHERAGRGFQRIGALLACSGPLVFFVGFPAAAWLFGALMTLLVVGVCVVALRSLGEVERGQLPR